MGLFLVDVAPAAGEGGIGQCRFAKVRGWRGRARGRMSVCLCFIGVASLALTERERETTLFARTHTHTGWWAQWEGGENALTTGECVAAQQKRRRGALRVVSVADVCQIRVGCGMQKKYLQKTNKVSDPRVDKKSAAFSKQQHKNTHSCSI